MSRPPQSTSRRDFLRASLLTGTVFGAPAALAQNATRKSAAAQGKARNVIFMVSDGMNHGALSLASHYRQVTGGKPLHWLQLYRERPAVRALMETFSASSIVTDSAAAASAWGAGVRVANGVINQDAGGKRLTPLHDKLRKAGRKTGLVTTATVTHATPAGFAASVSSRGQEADIAVQYLEGKVDVLLGGGRKFFKPELLAGFAAAGYQHITNRSELLKAPAAEGKAVLGLFADGYHPYAIDHANVPDLRERIPTLAEMTTAALARLESAAGGFFLMVEGARIDHAGHANDVAASVHEQLAFDDAIGAALTWLDKNPDTLLIITTDHGCGGIQMNGVNAGAGQGFAPGIYNATTASFKKLETFRRSVEWMQQQKLDALSGAKLAEAIEQHTGLKLSAEQTAAAQGLKRGYIDLVSKTTGTGWTGGNHTADLVEFCAVGPGSELFPAFLRNDEVHAHLLKAMDVA